MTRKLFSFNMMFSTYWISLLTLISTLGALPCSTVDILNLNIWFRFQGSILNKISVWFDWLFTSIYQQVSIIKTLHTKYQKKIEWTFAQIKNIQTFLHLVIRCIHIDWTLRLNRNLNNAVIRWYHSCIGNWTRRIIPCFCVQCRLKIRVCTTSKEQRYLFQEGYIHGRS